MNNEHITICGIQIPLSYNTNFKQSYNTNFKQSYNTNFKQSYFLKVSDSIYFHIYENDNVWSSNIKYFHIEVNAKASSLIDLKEYVEDRFYYMMLSKKQVESWFETRHKAQILK